MDVAHLRRCRTGRCIWVIDFYSFIIQHKPDAESAISGCQATTDAAVLT
jgi:hypothetical protein